MSKIKLVYFDFNFWRIDILRLSLAYAGIDYEFERIPREDWTKFKDKHPFGQLPIMYYKDNVFCHTHSLAIFCASKSNLYSSDEKKQIVINQVIDWANEITYRIAHSIREKNPEKSKKLRKIFIEKDFYTWFGYLDEFFKKNSSNSFFTGKLSIADITAWRVIRWFLSGNLEQIDTKFIQRFDGLKDFYEEFSSNEKIKNLQEFKEIMN